MAEVGKVKTAYYANDYVEEGFIKETVALPQVKFKYKPLNIIQTSKLTDAVMKTETIVGATEATLKMLTKQLIDWDITKPDNEKVDFTKIEELKKVDPTIINKIAGTIRGDRKGPKQDVKDIKDELKNL